MPKSTERNESIGENGKQHSTAATKRKRSTAGSKETSVNSTSNDTTCADSCADSNLKLTETVWWRYLARAVSLFAFGSAYSFVLNVAQAGGESARFAPGDAWLQGLLFATWWLPPLCGLISVGFGMLVPALDQCWSVRSPTPEPACTARVLVVMLGVHHASMRVPLAAAPILVRFALTAALCIALWLVFDRSPTGLGLASACYALAVAVAGVLDQRGLYDLEDADAENVACWLPTLFFASAITLATLGRQLAYSFAPADERPVRRDKSKSD